jgi:hypothetical protein
LSLAASSRKKDKSDGLDCARPGGCRLHRAGPLGPAAPRRSHLSVEHLRRRVSASTRWQIIFGSERYQVWFTRLKRAHRRWRILADRRSSPGRGIDHCPAGRMVKLGIAFWEFFIAQTKSLRCQFPEYGAFGLWDGPRTAADVGRSDIRRAQRVRRTRGDRHRRCWPCARH